MNHKGALSLGRTSLRCTGLVFLLVFIVFTHSAFAASPDIVISQVYGAGGNTNAPYNADFIELFNRGNTAVSLNGWSLQYASATGTGNFGANSGQMTELPNVTLQPGQYFLVQETAGTIGAALPTPDLVDPTPISMAAGAGKVALVMSNASLGCNGSSTPCTTAQLALIKDLVGYGNANFYETAPAPTLGTFTVALRKAFGCTDTDNNSADFIAASPGPRNTADIPNPCGGTSNPTGVGTATVNPVDPGQSTTLRVTVTPGGTTSGITVRADLSAIGGSAAQFFNNDSGYIYSFTITIPANQPEGSVTIPVTITDALNATGTTSINLTINAPPPPEVAIHTLQGTGNKAPADYLNKKISTSGIVTGVKSNGFFIQVPDNAVDSDPETSEAVYVFTSTAPPAAAAIGNLVKVTGTLVEFPSDPTVESLTEITTPTVTLLSTGNPLPAPITINAADTDPAGALNQLERLESMRVRFDSLTTTSGTGGSASNGSAGQNETNATGASNGLFFAVVTGIDRPFREPGVEPGIPLPVLPANTPHWDGNPELIRVDSDALVGAPQLEVTSKVTITNLVGVLDFGSTFYTVDPDPNSPHTVGTLMTAVPVSVAADREFTVASFNMQRFYDDVDDPGGDTRLTTDAFNRRLAKASLAIRNVLHYPDIIGVEEVEKLSTLQAIADRVSADAIAVGDPDPQYSAYLESGNDPSKINVGVLLKHGRVEHVSHEQIGPTATFVDPRDGSVDTLNDRPSLVVRVKLHPPVGQPFPLTIVVNHLRSLTDADTVGGAGDYARAKRYYQAEMLAQALQQMQTNGERIVSVGDYNAFELNDGYIDVIGAITGNPTAVDQVFMYLPDYVDPNLTDLVNTLSDPSQKYSYVENGSAQTLDHIIVSSDMLTRNYRLEVARNNADFPVSYRNDEKRSERLSDHDIPVGFFTFPPPSADLTVDMAAASNSVLSGSLQTYTITVTNNGPDPAANAKVNDSIPANTTFYSLTSDAGWACSTPAVGGTGQISCSTANMAPGATAQFTLNVLVNCATPDSTSLSNSATVSSDYVDTNTTDNNVTSTTTISNPAPVISGLAVDRSVLSPPNHKMLPVLLSYSISDNCETGLLPVISVSSDQPLNGIGDGNTATDWEIIDAHHLLLRAECAPTPDGRTYTITVRTADSAGNAASGSVTVNVPR